MPKVLVASDGAGLDAGVAAGLAALEKRYGFALTLSNLETRRADIARLSSDFDPEILEYALLPCPDGPGWGVNVNASMLAAAGGFLVSTDDDVFCEPARIGDGGSPALFSREYLAGDLAYRRDRAETLASVRPESVDVVAAYERYLGKRATDLVAPAACPDPGARVLVVSPGMYGDSAMGSSRSVLALSGRSRELLHAGGYESLRLSRELVRIAPAPTVSTSAQLIMTQTGFDDRVPLPPFLPYGRNPDGLCAVLTRLVYPSSLTAYLDFGLLHSPPEPRIQSRNNLTAYRPVLAEMLMALAITNRPTLSIEEPGARFEYIGEALVEAATSSSTDFVEATHAAWSRQLSGYVTLLESLLDQYGREPAAWAIDVDEHIDAVNAVLREPLALFGDTGCGMSVHGAKRHVRLYGELLAVWPALHGASADRL